MLEPNYLSHMADGTIKQLNPFTGTEVWTVPGRGNRPVGEKFPDKKPLVPAEHGHHCAFCEHRYLQTPPEKSRVIRHDHGYWETRYRVPAAQLFDTRAEFRRVPNLFEILSYDYWNRNYGYVLPPRVAEQKATYLGDHAGRDHVLGVINMKLKATGKSDEEILAMPLDEKLDMAAGFFGGGHDVIIARRHFVDGAADDSQLASSGTLTPDEHYQFTAFTVEAVEDLFSMNRYARYVSVFQNWLKPAGASFDHLHKQLVAIDERGVQNEQTLERLQANPNIFNELAVNYANYRNLIVAENDHAIAFAGFGHRYPSLEVYSKSENSDPWEHSPEELRGVSDLIHALHAAAGPAVACNEEWHYRPVDVVMAMPWRVVLKWRVSTLAGFEGATKIYINTIDPYSLRDRVVPALFSLRAAGKIAPIRIAFECECRPNPLRYNRTGRW